VQAIIDRRAKVFIGMGGNFVAAVPDRPLIEAAMRKLRLTVRVNTKLNRGHVVHGEQALILPCLARSDIDIQRTGRQSVTVEDSMSMVHADRARRAAKRRAEIGSCNRVWHGARDVA
jgi:anaerobic selenocysteine-containing dehydrogenase